MVPPALETFECLTEIEGSGMDTPRRSSVVDVVDYIQQIQMLCSRSSVTKLASRSQRTADKEGIPSRTNNHAIPSLFQTNQTHVQSKICQPRPK